MPQGPILITGAAGFIGSHLARALTARDERVVGIDNFDRFYDRRIKERNISDLPRDRFALYEVDLIDASGLSAVVRSCQPRMVIHLAALAGVRPSIAEPSRYAHVNLAGTVNLLEAARQSDCTKVLFASSSSVYGNRPQGGAFSEEDEVDDPASPYAATKRAGELICRTYAGLYGMSFGVLRFFTVYGPAQRPDLAISKFMRLILNDEPIPMFGDGTTARDYTYIDDIVAGVLAARSVVERADPGVWRLWNLGGSSPVMLSELIRAIGKVAGREPRVERLAMQPGDVIRTHADLTRVERELGWSPRTDLMSGLRRQWEWLNSHAVQ